MILKEGWRIGAGTSHRAIKRLEVIRERFRVLGEMESKLTSIQTCNWGTFGGNICHGDPASDPAAVLIALKASLKMVNSNRERSMAAEDFFLNYFETALDEDEMLLEVQGPRPSARTARAFEKFNVIENDMAIVSVAASITLDNPFIFRTVKVAHKFHNDRNSKTLEACLSVRISLFQRSLSRY